MLQWVLKFVIYDINICVKSACDVTDTQRHTHQRRLVYETQHNSILNSPEAVSSHHHLEQTAI